MVYYLRARSRICLLYKQENLDGNEELWNLSVDLKKRLSLLLPRYTGLGSVVCVASTAWFFLGMKRFLLTSKCR